MMGDLPGAGAPVREEGWNVRGRAGRAPGEGCSWQLSKVDISVTGVIDVSYILCPASP